MTDRRLNLAAAPNMRLAKPWPASAAEMPTELRLTAIGLAFGDDAEEWVRRLVERVDPTGQRDAAIRSAATLLWRGSISGTAKELEAELREKPTPEAQPTFEALMRKARKCLERAAAAFGEMGDALAEQRVELSKVSELLAALRSNGNRHGGARQ